MMIKQAVLRLGLVVIGVSVLFGIFRSVSSEAGGGETAVCCL